MEIDVSLETALARLREHPDMTAIMPLAALGSEVRMQVAEEPGAYRVAIWAVGPEPHPLTDEVTVNPLQFAALIGPLVEKNQRLLDLQGSLLVAEAEKFLAELT